MSILLLTACFRVPAKVEPGKSLLLEKYAKMPRIANECSGMVILDDEIVFLNDGGNGSYLYTLSMDGQDSLSAIEIKGAANRDWEALTRYKDQLIIGEFGNNLGNRKDLLIYHIDLETKEILRTVPFTYPDQKTFNDTRHNFDCEAIIVKDDSYLIFSKNRGNKNSNIYTAPIYSSEFSFLDSVALEGMVTDAIYHEESDSYLLLCYEFGFGGFKNSLAIVKRSKKGKFKTTNIFNIAPAEQFEAIAHWKGNQFLIGSELGLGQGRHLYIVTLEGL